MLTKYFAEGALVTSCTCYHCVLTFDLLSKYWNRSSIRRGLIGVSHKALSHLNPQLWGGGYIPPVCVCMCDCMQTFICVCVLWREHVTRWHWVFVLWLCNVLVQAVYMTCMCICHIFVGICALFVSYTCPVHCDSCTPQQGWTYLQCHPQTWGQQGTPGPLQRLLSFPCSLVPRSTPLLWQVLT